VEKELELQPDDGPADARAVRVKLANFCVLSKASIELWVLADKFLIPNLQNQVMDSLILLSCAYKRTPISRIAFIYENASPVSPLR
jgi:hypothetical protein